MSEDKKMAVEPGSKRRKMSSNCGNKAFGINEQHMAAAISVIVLRFFQEKDLRSCLPTLRLLSRLWRDVINATRSRLHVLIRSDFDQRALDKLLCRSPSLTSLTVEKTSDFELKQLYVLTYLTNVRSLVLTGFSYGDSFLLNIGNLNKLEIASPTFSAEEGLMSLTALHHLRTLSEPNDCRELPHMLDKTWDKLRTLEKLKIKLQTSNVCVELQGFVPIAALRAVQAKLSQPVLEMETLYNMMQLTSLVMKLPSFPESCYQNLSHLTNLTALEFTLISPGLPKWMKCLQELRYLSLTWYFSDCGGELASNILSTKLTCLTLKNVNSPPKGILIRQLRCLEKLAFSYTRRACYSEGAISSLSHKLAFGEAHAFNGLTNLTDLFIQRFSFVQMTNLPTIHHMHRLRNLHIESSVGIEKGYLDLVADNLLCLQRLIIGAGITDEHIDSISRIRSLETLTLMHSPNWTPEGFRLLGQLPRLRDLSLYFANQIEITEQEGWNALDSKIYFLFSNFPSLEHLGMSPLSELNKIHLPFEFEDDNRPLIIDDRCNIDTTFEME